MIDAEAIGDADGIVGGKGADAAEERVGDGIVDRHPRPKAVEQSADMDLIRQ